MGCSRGASKPKRRSAWPATPSACSIPGLRTPALPKSTIPKPWLYAGILVFATMGTIAANPSVVELIQLGVFGIMGFLMRRFDFPTAPVIIGMILGPLAETQFRRAMTISNGDWSVFYKHPLSLTLLTLAFIGLVGPHIWAYVEHRRRRGPEHVPGDA